MEAAVEFNLREIDGLARLLRNIQLSDGERTSLLNGLGQAIETQTQERFDTQMSPEGTKWQDLAEKTKAYYAKRFPGRDRSILVGEGQLRDTVTHELNGSWSVLAGATMVYAAVHQFGWEKKNIPARPYIGVSPENAADLAALAQTFLAGQFK
jgi:phage virion morphogenesis protein